MRLIRTGRGLKKDHEKGMALLFTFIVMIALTIMVTGYLTLVRFSTRNAGIELSDSQAFYLAEAGMNRAIWYLRNTAPDGSTGGSWRTSAYPTDPGGGSTDPKQESFGDGTYTMWVEDSGDNEIQITARGTVNDSQRTVRKKFNGPSWTDIIYDDFESGFGNWIDGGQDCIYYTRGTYAHEGNGAVDLQDNSSSSLMSTGFLPLFGYNQVRVQFWYYPRGMETGEDFWLQLSTYGGYYYFTVQSWAEGTDFVNNNFYEESVIISGYFLTNWAQLRLRLDASNNKDDVYFDEVKVSASTDPVGTLSDVADSWQEL